MAALISRLASGHEMQTSSSTCPKKIPCGHFRHPLQMGHYIFAFPAARSGSQSCVPGARNDWLRRHCINLGICLTAPQSILVTTYWRAPVATAFLRPATTFKSVRKMPLACTRCQIRSMAPVRFLTALYQRSWSMEHNEASLVCVCPTLNLTPDAR